MSLLIAFICGISVLIISPALQHHLRAWRRKRLQNLELRPNCLLTRHPIVFVSGRRSLFRLFDHWNDIPIFLREHGYEVLLLEPHQRSLTADEILRLTDTLKTTTSLATASSAAGGPPKSLLHLIGDSSYEKEFRAIASQPHPQIASLTLVRSEGDQRGGSKRKPKALSTDDLAPLKINIHTLSLQDLSLSKSIPKMKAHPWMNQIALWLLAAHNLFHLGARPKVDPFETGQFILSDWLIEARFLDLAISLAERDARWCDEA